MRERIVDGEPWIEHDTQGYTDGGPPCDACGACECQCPHCGENEDTDLIHGRTNPNTGKARYCCKARSDECKDGKCEGDCIGLSHGWTHADGGEFLCDCCLDDLERKLGSGGDGGLFRLDNPYPGGKRRVKTLLLKKSIVPKLKGELGIPIGKRIAHGSDKTLYEIPPEKKGERSKMVITFTRSLTESTVTEFIMKKQSLMDTPRNPYRVLFPAILRAWKIDRGPNVPERDRMVYACLREDVEPIEHKTPKKKWEDLAAVLDAVQDPLYRMWNHYGGTDDDMEDAQDYFGSARTIAPDVISMKWINSMMDVGTQEMMLWDLHIGNWSLRVHQISGYPKPGGLLIHDFGRCSLASDDLAECAKLKRHEQVKTRA